MRLAGIIPLRRITASGGPAGGGAAPEIILPFDVEHQEMDNWCWAAVTASVTAYLVPQHRGRWTQCAVATAELSRQCCSDPRPNSCDRTNTLDGPLSRVGHLRQPVISGYIRPQAIATELDADLPVPIRIQWPSRGGHFLAIRGIRKDGAVTSLHLTDPIYGRTTIDGNLLIQGGYQNSGSWSHTYVVTR
jgi:hypothetical protein